MAAALTAPTGKNMGLSWWDGNSTTTSTNLKEALKSAPILLAPDWNKLLELHIDASDYALGATSAQKDADNRTRLVAFASRKISSAERNYNANNRELLGLIYGLQDFKCNLEGSNYSLFTKNQVVSHFF